MVKLIPLQSFFHNGEKQAENFKQSRDGVTLLACASETCKLPLYYSQVCQALIDIEKFKDGKVKAMFLPPNITSNVQPMDQGIFEAML